MLAVELHIWRYFLRASGLKRKLTIYWGRDVFWKYAIEIGLTQKL
jgi:hypothetical protein